MYNYVYMCLYIYIYIYIYVCVYVCVYTTVVQKVLSFTQIFDLLHISHFCMSLTFPEIKTDI